MGSMGIILVLDDQDIEVLSKQGFNCEGLLAKARRGMIRAIRFSSLELICRTLECEPGDVLKLVDDSVVINGDVIEG